MRLIRFGLFVLSVILLNASAQAESVLPLTLKAREVRVRLLSHVTKEGTLFAQKKFFRAIGSEQSELKRKALLEAGSEAFVREEDRYWTLTVEQSIPRKMVLRHVSLVLTQRPDPRDFARLQETLELAQANDERVAITRVINDQHALPEGLKLSDLVKSDSRSASERTSDEIKVLKAEIARLEAQVKERERLLRENAQ